MNKTIKKTIAIAIVIVTIFTLSINTFAFSDSSIIDESSEIQTLTPESTIEEILIGCGVNFDPNDYLDFSLNSLTSSRVNTYSINSIGDDPFGEYAYIARTVDGKVLTYNDSGNVYWSQFEFNNDYQIWDFDEDNDGNYLIRTKVNSNKVLTYDYSDAFPSVRTYTYSPNYQHQKWHMVFGTMGNWLKTTATEGDFADLYLAINDTYSGDPDRAILSSNNSNNYKVGFMLSSIWTPITSVYGDDVTIDMGHFRFLYFTQVNQNGVSSTTSSWTDLFVTDGSSNIVAVEPNCKISGIRAGTKQLKVQNRITKVYSYFNVTVIRQFNYPSEYEIDIPYVEGINFYTDWVYYAYMLGYSVNPNGCKSLSSVISSYSQQQSTAYGAAGKMAEAASFASNNVQSFTYCSSMSIPEIKDTLFNKGAVCLIYQLVGNQTGLNYPNYFLKIVHGYNNQDEFMTYTNLSGTNGNHEVDELALIYFDTINNGSLYYTLSYIVYPD